ncbi:MAG: D-arabinono-1,4-lactone oxidase [Bacteroidota bacterium]
MIELKNFRWKNWAGNHSCIAQQYFEPQSEEEISEIVKHAAASGKKIRVCGAGHSFSPIALSDEFLVSLKNYHKLISVTKNTITVQGGMYLHELYAILQQHQLSLSNFGVINKQTVAGALATGTHGSGLKHKSLSAGIEKIKLVTANGELLEIKRDTEITLNGKKLNLWEAASVSLGLLGIVSEVTLRCEPLFYLRSEETVVDADVYTECMDDYARRYEYFKAWWFPHTGKVYLYKAERVGEELYKNKKEHENYSADQKKRDVEIDKVTAPLFIKSNSDTSLIPKINKDALDFYFTPRTRIGNGFEILVHDETVPMVVSEYGLSMENGNHRSALKELMQKAEKSAHKIHFPVDLRYTASETSWLSPSYGRDTFYIGMCVREWKKKEIPAQMKLFFDIMHHHHARPNWGKLTDLSATELKKLYPRLEDFITVKNYFDPEGRWDNGFTGGVFWS